MGLHLQLVENLGLPADVAAARERIADWRRTRRKKGAMPEELWEEAVSLARKHGVYRMSRDLVVDYGKLQARLHQAQQDRVVLPGSAAEDFVEVDASQLLGPPAADLSGPVLEASRADGTRLVIRLSGSATVDVVRLAAALWGAGAA